MIDLMSGSAQGRAFKLLCLLLLLFVTGCVSTTVKKDKDGPVFFPAPPELPRFQFLTSFSGSEDFKEKKNGLDGFLSGSSIDSYRLKKPYGISMYDSAIYVCDSMNSVWKFDLARKKFSKFKGNQGLGKLIEPINITIDKDGNKYVADPGRGAVIRYDKNDIFVKAYSVPGKWRPVDVEVYDGLLYVSDSTNHKGGIKVFELKTGEMVDTIGRSGAPETQLQIATNIAFDDEGYLFVMDAGRFRIVKYDRDGHYRGHLGSVGDSPGFFGRPRGVAVDHDGKIYAVDAAFDVVQVFAASGQVLGIFGGGGTTPGTLTLPAGIFIDYDHIDLFNEFITPGFEVEYLVLVTSQFHDNNPVSVYGFGRMSGEKYLTDEEIAEKVKAELLEQGSE